MVLRSRLGKGGKFYEKGVFEEVLYRSWTLFALEERKIIACEINFKSL